jgi:hypothetical protein
LWHALHFSVKVFWPPPPFMIDLPDLHHLRDRADAVLHLKDRQSAGVGAPVA